MYTHEVLSNNLLADTTLEVDGRLQIYDLLNQICIGDTGYQLFN